MTLLPEHERIFAARRAATLERLVREGIPRDWAEAWMAAWQRWASDETRDPLRDVAGFWEQDYLHARDENGLGRRPPQP